MGFAKPEYTETEAAEELGLSVDQLRAMIRTHILQEDADVLSNPSTTVFQRSDLVIMRLLLAACRFD